DTADRHETSRRDENQGEQALLPKRILVVVCSLEPGYGIEPSVPDAAQTRLALMRAIVELVAHFVHAKSKSRAAFTSSRRRTGVVCGARFTSSGVARASARISFIAV